MYLEITKDLVRKRTEEKEGRRPSSRKSYVRIRFAVGHEYRCSLLRVPATDRVDGTFRTRHSSLGPFVIHGNKYWFRTDL